MLYSKESEHGITESETMDKDERIQKANEQIHELQQMAAKLAIQQQELHDMVWKLRGNLMMI